MKLKNVLLFVCFLLAVSANAQTVSLSDLMSPDDVMLRKPAQKAVAEEKAKPDEQTAKEMAALRKQLEEAQAKAAKAEEAKNAAVAQAEANRIAAEKAAEDKVRMEKKVKELQNLEPDEKPVPAKPLTAGNSNQPDVTQMAVPEIAAAEKKNTEPKKKKLTGREAVITAERTDYDRKEGVILFDRNVYVDDEQYQMHSDRLFVFLDGTNQLKRLVAIGNVSITNDNKTAWCMRASYNKALSRIIMYGDDTRKALLREEGKKGGSTVMGDKITFWLDSEQVEIEGPAVSMPGGGLGGKEGAKSIFNQIK